MLRELRIENIAVIERAELTFQPGLSVLSGETGAGKSIIIDALNAILGGRVSRELIRTGQSRAAVTAVFDALSPVTRNCARELGLEVGEELILRREMDADGRNLCRVCGQPATLAMLRALGQGLVSIYGQHDGQHLLNEQLHIDYLDAFGGTEAAIAAYEVEYERLAAINRRIRALSLSTAEKEKRRAQLPPLIEELCRANIQPGEQEELLALRRSLQSGEKIAAGLDEAARALDGEEGEGALTLLAQAVKGLEHSARYSAGAQGLESRLRELTLLVQDISGELADLRAGLDYSPEKLEETEKRLELISRLCIRCAVPADGLEEHRAGLEAELAALDDLDQGLDRLKEDYAAQRAVVYAAAGELHEQRLTAAQRLSALVEGELRDLDLKNARFCVEVEDQRQGSQARFTKRGTDNVRFLLSANAGEDLKPLAKVASGGELSRIMLAMKNVLSAGEEGITSVFDEVDAGVSGRAASRVGEKLYAIARGRQVLCVTHLPQISCLADWQYHVEKCTREGRTFTEARLLDEAGRMGEIARMNAGLHVTQATLEGARELLDQARAWKAAQEKK